MLIGTQSNVLRLVEDKKMRWTVLFLFLISGCITYPDPRATSIGEVDTIVGADQPAEYRVGFREGCDSGHNTAGSSAYSFSKDAARYTQDELYKSGWDDGFENCGNRARRSNYYRPGYYYPRYYFSFGHHYRHGHHSRFGHRFGHRHH